MGLFDKLKGVVKGVQDAAQSKQAAGQGAVNAEPCTLERYAEIGRARSAWAHEGRDVDQLLQQQFGMTALDWSNASQYWSARIAGDYHLGLRYSELQSQLEESSKAQDGGGAASELSTRRD
jgi:hypothetical protein